LLVTLEGSTAVKPICFITLDLIYSYTSVPRALLLIHRQFPSEHEFFEAGLGASYTTTDVTIAITFYDGASDLTRRIQII
jgi:hypothetical protein